MDLENNNNDFLALPENLKLSGYNPDWAKYIKLKYQNSSDCSDEYSNVKIDLLNNQIIPIYPKIDDSTKKWFGSWEALLSNDNKETYSSSMLMIFSNNIDDISLIGKLLSGLTDALTSRLIFLFQQHHLLGLPELSCLYRIDVHTCRHWLA